MIEIPIQRVGQRVAYAPTEELVSVQRMQAGDRSRRCSWIWSSNYLQWQGPSSGAYTALWSSGDQGRTWGYLFRFANERQGTCRVQEIDAALRALGWEVDLEGDGP
jgi:hypothetical protein